MQPLDTIVFETQLVRAARFRCDVGDPRFCDSGPTENFLVTFPRNAVWIRYSGARSFVADSSLSTIYNHGQEFTRKAVDSRGDSCEWFAVSADTARDIAAAYDPHPKDPVDRPFSAQVAPVDRKLYLAQRALFTRLGKGTVDSLEAEEAIIAIVTAVVRRSFEAKRNDRESTDAHVDLVERAKAALSRTIFERRTLQEIATELGASPFHLCRVFHAHTGFTLHGFKTELRLRSALEKLEQSHNDLSRIAYETGFSSHSHFSAAMIRRFGHTPSAIRRLLAS